VLLINTTYFLLITTVFCLPIEKTGVDVWPNVSLIWTEPNTKEVFWLNLNAFSDLRAAESESLALLLIFVSFFLFKNTLVTRKGDS